jgi:hypothetical protein
MDFKTTCSEIKQFLSISASNLDLEQTVKRCFESESLEKKSEIASDILDFVKKFSMFKNISPFMSSVYKCIIKTLEIKPESYTEFKELLIKNTIMLFIQDYIEYSKIKQKRHVLKFLSDSLEKLQLQPLIINLGLMLKPMYQDQEYLNYVNLREEVEVVYELNSEIEMKIKMKIDQWLNLREIDLDNQNELRDNLRIQFERLIEFFKIPRVSEDYQKLLTEVMEMLKMRLLMKSFDSIEVDSLEPIQIK